MVSGFGVGIRSRPECVGMIPWLPALKLMSDKGMPLSALVTERTRLYPVSGEIKRIVSIANDVIAVVKS